MKKIYILLILVCLALSLSAQVNGELTQANGKWILKTWGTHTQRGYAHGYLLAQPIMDIFHGYYYQMVAMSNPTVYNDMQNFYLSHFTVEPKYQQEAQGIVNGLLDSDANTYIAGLSRDIMVEDVLMVNALVDMYFYRSELRNKLLQTPGFTLPVEDLELGCASLSSWGSATETDTLLAGNSVISRFMDWNSDADLIANPLLLISFPSDADEQPWLSFTYPGMMGALSAISASGKAAFLNMGNVHGYNDLTNLHPILLSIRNAIESTDYNLDGMDDIDDVFDTINDQNSLSGTLIHAVSEDDEIRTGIIETNNQNGTVMRSVAFSDGVPGMNLAATNHFRMLTSPVCCSRYENIIDSLTVNPAVNAKRQMSILTGAAGQDNNMMALQYVPSTGKILWSVSSLEQPAFQREMSGYFRDELLDFDTANEDNQNVISIDKLNIYPNPAHSGKSISIQSAGLEKSNLNIYNLKGQKVAVVYPEKNGFVWNGMTSNGSRAATGLYLLQTQAVDGKSISGKVLIVE